VPLYDYRCGCGQKFTRLVKLADYQQPQTHCEGLASQKLVSAPAIHGDYEGYQCPVTDKWIEGRRAHEENLKRTGCRLYEPGETEAYKRGLAKADESLEASIDASTEQFIHELPLAKREQLAVELQSGLDVSVERSTVIP